MAFLGRWYFTPRCKRRPESGKIHPRERTAEHQAALPQYYGIENRQIFSPSVWWALCVIRPSIWREVAEVSDSTPDGKDRSLVSKGNLFVLVGRDRFISHAKGKPAADSVREKRFAYLGAGQVTDPDKRSFVMGKAPRRATLSNLRKVQVTILLS